MTTYNVIMYNIRTRAHYTCIIYTYIVQGVGCHRVIVSVCSSTIILYFPVAREYDVRIPSPHTIWIFRVYYIT